MNKGNLKCFLASNSAEGFVSFFGDCYDPCDGWKANIIKGGPGTGKSSFMRKVLKQAEKCGICSTAVYCASDPDSLDGVILPEIKTVFMDGTSPHTIEPMLPGVCDRLLDFGRFWKEEKLLKNKDGIIGLTMENKALHKKAAEHIFSAGKILSEGLGFATPFAATKSIIATAEALKKEYIPKKGGLGRKWMRLLGGVTPDGMKYFAESLMGKVIVLKDSRGANAKPLFDYLINDGISKGYEVIVYANPILPSTLVDAVEIPELDLCFIMENEFLSYENSELEIDLPRHDKTYDGFRSAATQITAAGDIIKQAKTVHDRLESYYIAAMDFDAVNSFVDEVLKKIFGY